MKIEAIDKKCRIEIAPVLENDWPSFRIEAHVSIEHGAFSGKNEDVAFLNLPEFLAELDRFILNRQLKPRLDATYGTYLSFQSHGRSVVVEFCLGDAFSGYSVPANYALSGSFEVGEESLVLVLWALREIAERPNHSLQARRP